MMAAIALLVFIPAVESCLRLSSNTTTVNVTTGSDVLLNCHFVYKFKLTLGMISVSWRRQPATEESQQMIAHFDGLNLQTFYNNSFLSPKALLEGDASLLMKNVSNSDTGDYFCDVLVTPVKKEIQLNLNVAGKQDLLLDSMDTSKISMARALTNVQHQHSILTLVCVSLGCIRKN
ncbi:natural cytotoxicity triggering receptor 3 ligand 1-like isoform X1 [Polypterus senegalus]|uniref:natural cytotoxicity triggering receptor 3 ligand 1-like isoform X1 n=1 Tax=Polypterus senegalus TaxID=55291 RepID=UPI00196671A8|nr:natural cytotoxicity triggering receptor 3 ligand 1-like isoform X1 [Polypterus senegalus]